MNFQEIFGIMVDKKASHFHLVPGSPIMMRQSGTLSPMDSNILSPQDTRNFLESLMNDAQKKEFEGKMELDFTYSVPGLSRFRINIFKQRGSVAAVVLMNPPNPPTIEELGLPELLKNIALNAKQGLILLTGPKASGKSHTMAALVNYILEMRTCQIITLENPIDFLHKNKRGVICQREVGTDTVSYPAAFKSLTHQGADILVIGEVNSYEIASNLLNLAASGQLVIATSTSPSVLVMLEQLIDLFPPHLHQQARTLLSVGLEAIIAQTLLTRVHGGGLVPAFEILLGTSAVKALIREGKLIQVQNTMATSGREVGMQSQEQALRFLVKKNVVTMEEASSKAVRPEEFKKLMSLPY